MTHQTAEIPFEVPPVIKSVEFAGTPEQAFERFSRHIGAWWPLATHSISRRADGVSVAFEQLQPGGRLVELCSTGKSYIWGTIIAFDRPDRLAFTWHVGRGADAAQWIEITCTSTGPARTTVRLIHSGWESLGETAATRRDEYERGWDAVLHRFAPGGPRIERVAASLTGVGQTARSGGHVGQPDRVLADQVVGDEA